MPCLKTPKRHQIINSNPKKIPKPEISLVLIYLLEKANKNDGSEI